MISKSEVTIRCFQPEDSVRCCTLFTEGMKELCIPVMKTFYLVFLKIAAIFLVIVSAIAVKWSVLTLLVFYFVLLVVITAAAYVYVYLCVMNYINRSLKSDLLDIEKYYDGHDSCMFVAECDGRVIGMVGVATKEHHKPGVAELQRMSVCSTARGKGIGRILMNKVMDYCKEKKYGSIILSTSSAQYAAVALYEKQGFKCLGKFLLTTVTMTSKSEVTIRCFRPEDSVRCCTIFTEGMKGLCIPVMKTFYLVFLKIAAIFLVIVSAIAVKWSVWTLLVFYVVLLVVITAAAYVYVYLCVMNYINHSLKSDLLDIEKYYDGHDSCMFVAECDGRVIGMVGVATKEHHKPGVAELRRMSVCSTARRKRIGTILVNKVIDYCKEKKYDKIILSTAHLRRAAVALYKKHGFKVVKSELYLPFILFNVYDLYFEKNI